MAGVETTYGTSAAPTGSQVMRVGNDLQLSPLQMELADRDLLYPYAGNRPRVAAQKMAGISLSFELTGSGDPGTPPRTGLFFRAAGYSETIVADTSVTYAPIGSSFEGITLDVRHGGKKHLLTGVRGELSFDLKTGSIPVAKFEGMGFYSVPTDVANPSLTYGDQAEPLVVNSTNTPTVSLYSYSSCLESFTFKAGRSPKLHQRAGCTAQVRIDTERKPEGEVSIESPTIAQKDFFSQAANQTGGALTWTHGITAGNIVTFNASGLSLGDPAYEDGDGVELLKLPFMPIPTATNGYDDHSFVFT
jgi:hypothetical protein